MVEAEETQEPTEEGQGEEQPAFKHFEDLTPEEREAQIYKGPFHKMPKWGENAALEEDLSDLDAVIAAGKDGPDLETTRWLHTPAWYAAKHKLWDRVHALLDIGANPNAVDDYDYTIMMWAARDERMDIIDKLLELGSDINDMTQYGFTALMWAQKYVPESDIPDQLMQRGAYEKIPKPWEDGCPAKFAWKHLKNKKTEAEKEAEV